MSTTNNDQPACQSQPQYVIPASDIPDTPPDAVLFQDIDHLTMLAGTVIASTMEYGCTPELAITPAEMPTPGTRQMLALVHDAVDAGIKSQSDVVEYIMGHLPGPEFAAIVGDLMAISDFQSVAPKPKSCRAAVAALRAHAQAHRRWELAREILTRGSAGEDVAALVSEMHALGTASSSSSIGEIAAARVFDFDVVSEKPTAILSIGDRIIATPGNLVNVQAPAKAGKSAALAGMLAAFFRYDPQVDCLGFSAENPLGRAVVHFDTEQSRYDHEHLVRRAFRRAEVTTPPTWFSSYSIADLDLADRWELWEHVLKTAAREHGGIMAVFLDGVADLVRDPNDAEEAFATVRALNQIATRYECSIITVLHENPGSEIGKTRGHLGSEIVRKAETNLRLAKDAQGVTTVWTDHARHCHLPRDQGTCFEWSDQAGMHVSCGTAREIKAQTKRNEMEQQAALCIGAVTSPLTYGELVGRIQEHLGCSERTAKTRAKEWKIDGLLKQLPDNKYERTF